MGSKHNISRSHKLVEFSQRFQSKFIVSNQPDIFNTPKRAAVLICLFEQQDDIYVILTKRSSKLSSFSGQVSLPGGRTDEEDIDDIGTALREAEEEIGLDPALVDVVTVLQPFWAKGNITVVPVIGILWNKQTFIPVPNADEVESIFYAPLEMFLKNENRQQDEVEIQGGKGLSHRFHYEANNNVYVIWAVTAAMLMVTASIVYQRPPDFQRRMPRCWNQNQSRL